MDTRIISNKIFFGCNYNDKSIKSQFDNLKKKLEKKFPLDIVIIDKKRKKHAKDLWQDIQKEIQESAALFFDLSGFRPNVVLELGYSLALKDESQVYITYRVRKSGGKKPLWILSDIGHLIHHEYINMDELQEYVEEQIQNLDFMKNLEEFKRECSATRNPENYIACALEVIKGIRTEGSRSKEQLIKYTKGTGCQVLKLIQLMKKHSLIKGTKGKYQRYVVMTEEI